MPHHHHHHSKKSRKGAEERASLESVPQKQRPSKREKEPDVGFQRDGYVPAYYLAHEIQQYAEEMGLLVRSEKNSFYKMMESYHAGAFFITNYRFIFHYYPRGKRNRRASTDPEVNVDVAADESSGASTPTARRASSVGAEEELATEVSVHPPEDTTAPPEMHDLQIPMMSVLTVTEVDSHTIVVRTKMWESYTFNFRSSKTTSTVVHYFEVFSVPNNTIRESFAMRDNARDELADAPEDGWSLYDYEEDYRRLGLLDLPTLKLQEQSDFSLCDTYPKKFLVSTSMDLDEYQEVINYRSRGRLPVPVFLHPRTKAILMRCAQPNTGLQGKRCSLDEDLLPALASAGCVKSNRYFVCDARSQIAAFGNRSMGKGTENPDNYKGMTLYYMNIANIHAARESLNAMTDLFFNRMVGGDDDSFPRRLNDAGWVQQVRSIVCSILRCIELLEDDGCSVISHCSDGWDRTSQMTAGTELMIDPHYRTLRGFAQLIEKEFCCFGHQFCRRLGMNNGNAKDDKRSPIFLLFLDTVYQFLVQFPSAFEFNESLLLFLTDHLYSARFGTFMCDCDKDRWELDMRQKTNSIWTYVLHPAHIGQFQNASYQQVQETLRPNCHIRQMKLWKGLFCRGDADVTPSPKREFCF